MRCGGIKALQPYGSYSCLFAKNFKGIDGKLVMYSHKGGNGSSKYSSIAPGIIGPRWLEARAETTSYPHLCLLVTRSFVFQRKSCPCRAMRCRYRYLFLFVVVAPRLQVDF